MFKLSKICNRFKPGHPGQIRIRYEGDPIFFIRFTFTPFRPINPVRSEAGPAMALVDSSGDTDLRIYEPSLACEYAPPQERADHRSRLLAAIHSAYCKAES